MPEDGAAQVVHHVLSDAVREECLVDAERAGCDRHGDHAAGVERELPRAAAWIASRAPLRRNAGATPSVDESAIRPRTNVRRFLYGRKSPKTRRRFARRTRLSAGRSGCFQRTARGRCVRLRTPRNGRAAPAAAVGRRLASPRWSGSACSAALRAGAVRPISRRRGRSAASWPAAGSGWSTAAGASA